MHRWLVLFASGIISTIAFGCSGGDDDAQFNPGCTNEPNCEACGDCYSLCVCTTGNIDMCKPACGITTGSGGTAGSPGTGGTAGTPGTGGASSGGSAGTGGTTPAGGLAAGLRISEISVYQAVKVPIMQNGGAVAQTNAPVVAGRDALVRVAVSPDQGFQPREIVARLELAGQAPIEITKFVSGPSADNDLNSSFNLEVPGAMIAPGSGYSLSLLETGPGGPGGATDGARFPAQGEAPTGAQSSNGPLKVVVIPMISNGYTPNTTDGKIEALRRRLMALYPVPEVQITLHAPVNTVGVSGNGSGFNSALDHVINIRQQEKPGFNVYYYGILAPAQSAGQFCGYGCVAGLSVQAGANDQWGRSSVGIGYFPDGSALDAPDTMAHELGHAHGLPHAPCQVQDAGQFPYPGGAIGVWGYDAITKQLLNPQSYKDVMGYCDPDWISDFNFKRLFTRVTYVNSNAYMIPAADPTRAPGRFRMASVDVDGSLSWGSTIDTQTSISGQEREITLLDAKEQPIGSVVGFFYPYTHLPGGILLVREKTLGAQAGAAALKPAGFESTLKL